MYSKRENPGSTHPRRGNTAPNIGTIDAVCGDDIDFDSLLADDCVHAARVEPDGEWKRSWSDGMNLQFRAGSRIGVLLVRVLGLRHNASSTTTGEE